MIIERIFQGTTPIRRIYQNGHIVWRPLAFLPPYIVYVSTNPTGDQILTKIELAQFTSTTYQDPIISRFHAGAPLHVEHGSFVDETAGLVYLENGVTGLDAFLINRIAEECHKPAIDEGKFNAFTAKLLQGEILDDPVLYGSTFSTSLGGEILNLTSDEKAYIYGDQFGLSARGFLVNQDADIETYVNQQGIILGANGRVGLHDERHKTFVNQLGRFLDSKGRVGLYSDDHEIGVIHKAFGVDGRGRVGLYSDDHKIYVDHRAVGIDGRGRVGRYADDHKIYVDHSAIGVDGRGRVGLYVDDHSIGVIHKALGTDGRGKIGRYSDDHDITVDQKAFGLTADGLIGHHTAEPKATIDSRGKVLDAKAKQVRKDDPLEQNVDQNANLLKLDTELLTDICEISVDYTSDANMPSVSIGPISFTKFGGIYTSEQTATRARIENIAGDEITRLATNTSAIMQIMHWKFPTHEGTNLYIPQVYHDGIISSAVQNGSELVM